MVRRRRGGYTVAVIEREELPTDVGEGYPEDAPPGTGIDPQEHAENELSTEQSAAGANRDGDPGQATGNPKAAGADDA
jgi:hypothetical protein